MKVYFNKEQFPEAAEKCYANPRHSLNRSIEYIASDENKVVVAPDDADQEDFEMFWDELGVHVSYLTMAILDSYGEMYRAMLEETYDEQDDLEKSQFLRFFKVEGVDWLVAE